MLRKIYMILVLALVGAPVAMSNISPAEAKVTINIQVGPGYYLPPHAGYFSCRTIAERLWYKGYNSIRVNDCRGSTYVYTARRAGKLWRIKISSRSGRTLEVYRIR